ncbi:MAG: hypothetical protein ABI947_10385 [Chloroflexota bacterium]
MPTIAAANNLTIQAENTMWSLLNGTGETPVPIVQATPHGLQYRPSFGTARRLPSDGRLSSDQITTVVVGWAVEDSSWHLGLMLTAELAQSRGGRWCGLARWSADGDENATLAGELLADMLDKPFRRVAPTPSPTVHEPPVQISPILAQSAQSDSLQDTVVYSPSPLTTTAVAQPGDLTEPIVVQEPIEPPPLMPLPLTMGEWTMSEDDEDLLWERSRGWRNKTLLNAAFFAVLTLIFGTLSVGARLSLYAPVQPEWLPYVGLALTALMIILFLGQVSLLLRATSVVIDNQQRLVRVVRGYRPGTRKVRMTLAQAPYEGIDYVLVSHVMSRQESGTAREPGLPSYDRIWPEVWIHLYSPRRGFINVCYISQTEGRMLSGLSFSVRRSLNLAEIDTPAHHAAVYMAEKIGIPAYVETR